MKRIIICFFSFLTILGCRKTEVTELFSEAPEVRAKEKLNELQSTLVDAKNGWKGTLRTSLGGGYTFYIKFNSDNTLEMMSDINTTTATVLKESTYRTKWVMEASLIFDTYNYISLLQDPGNKVPGAGGKTADGLQSDIEFEYVRTSQDSVFLTGKRYGNSFLLVRLSPTQEESYLTSFKTKIDETKALISSLKFPYLEIDGIPNKISFVLDQTSKKIGAEYMLNETDLWSGTGKFGFDVEGVSLTNPLSIGNISLNYGLVENGKLWFVDKNNKKFELKSNSVPILPILNTFGYNKANKRILSDAVPGVTANVDVFQRVRELFATSGRTVTSMYFQLSTSTTAIFYVGYTSGTSAFVASSSYTYRQEGENIYLKRSGIDGGNNWTTRAAQVLPVTNLFGTGEERAFKIGWVTSSNSSVTYPIAGIRSVSNSSDLLFGKIGN